MGESAILGHVRREGGSPIDRKEEKEGVAAHKRRQRSGESAMRKKRKGEADTGKGRKACTR